MRIHRHPPVSHSWRALGLAPALALGALLIAMAALVTVAPPRASEASAGSPAAPPADLPWMANLQLTAAGDPAAGPPSLAAAGATVWAAWRQGEANEANLAYMARSSDAGATWTAPSAISVQSLGTVNNVPPVVAAVAPGTLHVAWYQSVLYESETISYIHSTDGGASWQPLQTVAGGIMMGVTGLAIAAGDAGGVYLAWTRTNGLWLARSTDGGATWGAAQEVRSMAALGGRVALAASPFDGSLHLAWDEATEWGQPNHILYSRSTDDGATWSAPVTLSTAADYAQTQPAIAVDPGNGTVHAAWADSRPGTDAIYHVASATASGASWGTPQAISGAGPAAYPALTTWGAGVVFAAWQDSRDGTLDIRYNRSDDGGVTWLGIGRVNDSATGAQQRPALAAGQNVYAAWQDDRSGKFDIYSARLNSDCAVPLAGAGISGPAEVARDTVATLTGSYLPANATSPTFSWSPGPASGQGTLSAGYSWAEPGKYPVTFTANNCGGAHSAVRTVTVTCPAPVTWASISGLALVQAGVPVVLDAVIAPANAYQPSYTWSPAPSSGQGTAHATYLWPGVGVHEIHLDVTNCNGGWGTFSADFTVTTEDQAGPGWSDLRPAGWISNTQSPAVGVRVRDAGTGLNVGSGQYWYTTNGGIGWTGPWPLSFSAANGVTTLLAVTNTLYFGQDSGASHSNRVRFQAADMAGNTGQATFNVDIDTTAPTNPTLLTLDRPAGAWSTNPAAAATLGGATDASSGVGSYLYQWTQSATGVPAPGAPGVSAVTATGGQQTVPVPIPAGGQSWWLHVRAVDRAGNLAPGAVHAGPYWLDATPPPTPQINGITLPLGVLTTTHTVTIHYGSSDPGGSGLAGYSYEWSHSSTTVPDAAVDTARITWVLTDGTDWWFHVRAVDNAGNSSGTARRGPFKITAPPTAPAILSSSVPPNQWTNAAQITVNWAAATGSGGIAGYSVQWSQPGTVTPDCQVETTGLSSTSPALSGSPWWYFNVRARDSQGFCGPAVSIGPFKSDRLAPHPPIGVQGMRVQGQDWLEAWWLPADDPWPASGIQGYSFKWSLNPSEVPAAVINTAAISATSGILSEGAWYFLIRARDNAGSWSPPAIDGPYVIDKTPPANPSFSQFTSQPIRQTWTTHCNLQVNWTAPADPAPGSGIWAYSVKWDDRPDTLPPAVPSTYAATSSYCASNGNSWYVHVRTVDNQGNWAATAAHYGPFYVDMTIPYCHVNTPAAVDDSEWLLTWQIKSVSPVADSEVRYKDVTANSGWMTLVGPTIDTQTLFANTQPGHVYDFSCRATSSTGSVGDWSSGYDQRTRVETIDFEVTGLEAVQTVQDLNNSVPLITQKRTFVRFHVRAPYGDFSEPVKARLWVTLSGQTMAVLDPFESPILPRLTPIAASDRTVSCLRCPPSGSRTAWS